MEQILRKHHLKVTDKRLAILKTLGETSEPLLIEQIHEKANKLVKMNLSTAYRTLSILCEKNIVLENINYERKAYYQLNHHRHQHTLVCSKCNKMLVIDVCPLHELEKHLEKETGFSIHDHNLEFIGTCPSCQE